jgi:hypothetical protein
MSKTIYYSIGNGGDGSAYIRFFDEEILADMHQSFEAEWGDDCTGTITIEGENISCNEVGTRKEYIAELEQSLEWCDEGEDDGEDEVSSVHDVDEGILIKRYIRMLYHE